jgi:hypothetical protein
MGVRRRKLICHQFDQDLSVSDCEIKGQRRVEWGGGVNWQRRQLSGESKRKKKKETASQEAVPETVESSRGTGWRVPSTHSLIQNTEYTSVFATMYIDR